MSGDRNDRTRVDRMKRPAVQGAAPGLLKCTYLYISRNIYQPAAAGLWRFVPVGHERRSQRPSLRCHMRTLAFTLLALGSTAAVLQAQTAPYYPQGYPQA